MDINGIGGVGRAVAPPLPQKQAGPSNLASGQVASDALRSRNDVVDTSRVAQTQAVLTNDPSVDDPTDPSKSLEAAVKKVQDFVNRSVPDIKFSIDEESGRTVVKVIDPETKDIIRQIPSEEMLDIARALDKLQGLLIRQKA